MNNEAECDARDQRKVCAKASCLLPLAGYEAGITYGMKQFCWHVYFFHWCGNILTRRRHNCVEGARNVCRRHGTLFDTHIGAGDCVKEKEKRKKRKSKKHMHVHATQSVHIIPHLSHIASSSCISLSRFAETGASNNDCSSQPPPRKSLHSPHIRLTVTLVFLLPNHSLLLSIFVFCFLPVFFFLSLFCSYRFVRRGIHAKRTPTLIPWSPM